MAGYARIQKWCLYAGLDRLRDHGRADAHLEPGRLQGRPSTGPTRTMFGVQGAYDKTLADAAVNDAWVTDARADRPRREHRRHPARDPGDDPVHAVLDPVPELGLDAVRRGPRLGRLPQGPARHARRHLGDRRPGARRSCCSRRRRSAGTSSPRPTPTSSTTSTATRRPTPTVPIWSYPPLLASYLIDNSIFQIAMVVLFGVVVPGLVGDAVPVVDADDLRGGVRPGPARPRRPGVRAAGGPGHRPAVHHGPGDRGRASIYAYSSDFRALTLDATLVIAVTFLGSAVAADDPALVQAGDLRQLAGRPPQARRQRGRADHRDHPRLDDLPVAVRTRCTGSASATPNSIIFLGVVYGAGRDRLHRGAARTGAARASTSTPSTRRSRPSRPGPTHATGRRRPGPRGAVRRFSRRTSRVGPGRVFCQMCLASRYSSRPVGPSSRPMPGLLEAAPLGLRQVGVVVVDPDRPVAQPRGDPLGAPGVRGPDRAGQPVGGVVAERDGLVLGREALDRSGPARRPPRGRCASSCVTSAKTVGR